MATIGKSFIYLGAILIITGIIIVGVSRITGTGRLPGYILIKKENFTFYFPITTCIIAGIIISFALFLFARKR